MTVNFYNYSLIDYLAMIFFRKGYIDNRNMNLPFLLGLYGTTILYNKIYKCLYKHWILFYYHGIYEEVIHSNHGYSAWRDELKQKYRGLYYNEPFDYFFKVRLRLQLYNALNLIEIYWFKFRKELIL